MKATKLIELLAQSIAEHGDRDIVVHVDIEDSLKYAELEDDLQYLIPSFGTDGAQCEEEGEHYPFEIWVTAGKIAINVVNG